MKNDKPSLPSPIRKDTDAPREDARFSLSKDYRHPSFHPRKEPLLRKRSVAVVVGVLGIAAVGIAAFGGKDVQRNSYASQEDCEQDYATGQCTREATSSGYRGGGYHYYGPWYRSDWRDRSFAGDPGPGRSFRGGGVPGHGPSSVDFGRRGGFGSSGRVSARGS
ncbi:hypothetical protein SAMN02800694_1552 [Luteibacter sp. UNCMF331Sha3.1]|uniref:hypothetical protein n=1 Tax=Luteibacter sp. UNCMF331Sha3.1 TaxID=1502760 RepID=UPI0008CE22C4|nr:hypothetical protein [Luteibacter sp. UNCMF331Sha3.1]SEM57051.1 hypothetical protein SAMN02800694_1552 [Luteibacter sp. UNCMF331Sha3.1]